MRRTGLAATPPQVRRLRNRDAIPMTVLPADDGSSDDWLYWLGQADFGDKLDLSILQMGDALLVESHNSRYQLVCEDAAERWFDVRCNQAQRPQGWMRLMGCTVGQSSSISPDALFCGGNLELRQTLSENETLIHRTSTIRKIGLRQKRSEQKDDS